MNNLRVISVVGGLVFVMNLGVPAQETELIDIDTVNRASNSTTYFARISGDGSRVAFVSFSRFMIIPPPVEGDGILDVSIGDIYVKDRVTNTLRRVTSPPGELVGANGLSASPQISDDGRYVVYESAATDLIAGDKNGKYDIFQYDMVAGTNTRVAHGLDGEESNGHSFSPDISADGAHVVFLSEASNLVENDTNNRMDTFLWERATGAITLVSRQQSGTLSNKESGRPTISGDGGTVAFETYAGLVPEDTNELFDIYRYDVASGAISLVSEGLGGAPSNGDSYYAAVSHDGSVIAYYSFATNLITGDQNGVADVFVHDQGVTTRVSVGAGASEADGKSLNPSISADGNRVCFESLANIDASDVNGLKDFYVHDRTSLTTELFSVATGGVPLDLASYNGEISADGATVAFTTDDGSPSDLDNNSHCNIYVHGPAVSLGSDVESVSPGESFVLRTFSGDPGALTALFLVGVDGLPVALGLSETTLNQNGAAETGFAVPANLDLTASVEFQCFAFHQGRVAASNRRTIRID